MNYLENICIYNFNNIQRGQKRNITTTERRQEGQYDYEMKKEPFKPNAYYFQTIIINDLYY